MCGEKFKAADMKQVTINDTFIGKYVDLVREVMIPYQWEVLNDRIPGIEPSHAIDNFLIAAGRKKGNFYGEVFQDSDLAKWLEAAAFCLACHPDPELEKTIDEVVELIQEAQQEDGYLDTYFMIGRQEEEWKNLYECHEMYCAGHMMEAAVAYYLATGKRTLLDVMCRCADHVARRFGPEKDQIQGYPGHQEIELALVKLYEVTGNQRYLDLSRYFLEERGKDPNYFVHEWETSRRKCTFKTNTPVPTPDLEYNQSHKPVDQQREAVGHSVRAMYMYTAMADIARLTKDEKMYDACRLLWENVTKKQMYITGAIGSTHIGEAFTFDYDLPNETAYAETCASIGLAFFAHRMLRMDLRGEYGDIIEKVLYNVVLASMSTDGKRFFYVNPMEVWPEASRKNPDRKHVKSVRQSWYGCACCPPNIARFLSSLGQYIYSYDDSNLYVHLYISGEAKVKTEKGFFAVKQSGNYPLEEQTELVIEEIPEEGAGVALRIPGWCREWTLRVNEKQVKPDCLNGYVWIRHVEKGTKISLHFAMKAQLMCANPQVKSDAGKAAIQRGPMVFCLEEVDNGKNLSAIRLDKNCDWEYHAQDQILDGIGFLRGKGFRRKEEQWDQCLYAPLSLEEEEILVKAVPYFLWGNRGEGEMQVWCRY